MDSTKNNLTDDPLWYKRAVFYELYIRAFRDTTGSGNGDLQGVIEKLDYLADLGVTCIWLLPFFPSPLEDDGYDVADYCGVHADYGTLDDFKELVEQAHRRGMRIITDLVINHTSNQHPWFLEARSDPDSPYRDYYVWSDSENKYSEARIIFLDTEDSNWSWDEEAGQFFWHRFYRGQPDLNYDNPAVQQEILEAMKFWLDLGIDGFRVDAIPYLFEQEGTNSENLKETHEFLKKARRFIEKNYPGRILLSEANQWPEDVLPYFGDGDEMHMAFHFPLMPRIFMALKQGNGAPIRDILDRTPQIPQNAQWALFLRNHDELTLEMVTEEEREWMWEAYAPEPRMRINLGIRRRLAPLLDNDVDKISLATSLLFSLPGSPTLYYGDEIGMGDNIWLDDRNGLRTPMQWGKGKNGGFSETEPDALYSPVVEAEEYAVERVNVTQQQEDGGSFYHRVKKMIAVTGEHATLSLGNLEWLEGNIPQQVLGYTRFYEEESILVLNNLSGEMQEFDIDLSKGVTGEVFTDLLSGESWEAKDGKLNIAVGAYRNLWLLISSRTDK